MPVGDRKCLVVFRPELLSRTVENSSFFLALPFAAVPKRIVPCWMPHVAVAVIAEKRFPRHSGIKNIRPVSSALAFIHQGKISVVVICITVKGHSDLFQVALAESLLRLFPRLVQSRKKNPGKDRDDRNDDKEFYQCEILNGDLRQVERDIRMRLLHGILLSHGFLFVRFFERSVSRPRRRWIPLPDRRRRAGSSPGEHVPLMTRVLTCQSVMP